MFVVSIHTSGLSPLRYECFCARTQVAPRWSQKVLGCPPRAEASRSHQETFSSTWRTFDDFFQNSFFDMSQPYSESRKIVRILHAKFTCSLSQKKVARNKKCSKTPMFWWYFWLLMSVNIKFSKHLGGRLATLLLSGHFFFWKSQIQARDSFWLQILTKMLDFLKAWVRSKSNSEKA